MTAEEHVRDVLRAAQFKSHLVTVGASAEFIAAFDHDVAESGIDAVLDTWTDWLEAEKALKGR